MFKNFIYSVTLTLIVFCLASPSLAEMVSIKSHDVNVRSGPGKGHDIIWEYGKGFPLQVIKNEGQWLNIEDFEGDKGWVHNSLTDKDPHVIVKANKTGQGKVNVRKSPNTDSDIIAHASYGVVFKTIKQENGWAKVEHEDKKIVGWVKRSLLWGF